jgi:SAM-dependent methyltransferase
MDKNKILLKIKGRQWFHSFELLPGTVTPGRVYANPKKRFDKIYKIPVNLLGLKALDIGTWDGPYAFELERRGADVIALDVQDPSCTGFNTAKEIIHSNVQYIQASVYDLSKVLNMKFDIILFFGVYYHLKYPILAFEQIHKVLKDDGLLLMEGECLRNWAPVPREAAMMKNPVMSGVQHCKKKENTEKWQSLLRKLKLIAIIKKFYNALFRQRPSKFVKTIANSDVPITLFYSGQYKQDPSNWFIPNLACIREWLATAGLKLTSYGFNDKIIPRQRFWGKVKKL